MAFRELRTHFPSKKWPLSGGALRAQFISNLAARYARKEWVGGRGPARYARTYFLSSRLRGNIELIEAESGSS